MATMNSQKHMPAAPISNSLRRPSLSMSCTPTMVIAVLTTSAIILEIWRSIRVKRRRSKVITHVMMNGFEIPEALKKVVP